MSDEKQSFYQLINKSAAGRDGSWPYGSRFTTDFSGGKVIVPAQRRHAIHLETALLISTVT